MQWGSLSVSDWSNSSTYSGLFEKNIIYSVSVSHNLFIIGIPAASSLDTAKAVITPKGGGIFTTGTTLVSTAKCNGFWYAISY